MEATQYPKPSRNHYQDSCSTGALARACIGSRSFATLPAESGQNSLLARGKPDGLETERFQLAYEEDPSPMHARSCSGTSRRWTRAPVQPGWK